MRSTDITFGKPEMIYPINYGYVDGVFAGDGAEVDVYVFGTDQPIETYTGKVTAVYHRLNDNEDKWIVSVSGEIIPAEDILDTISFQEQYYMGELYTLLHREKDGSFVNEYMMVKKL